MRLIAADNLMDEIKKDPAYDLMLAMIDASIKGWVRLYRISLEKDLNSKQYFDLRKETNFILHSPYMELLGLDGRYILKTLRERLVKEHDYK